MYGLHGSIQANAGQRDALTEHLLHAAELMSELESNKKLNVQTS